MSEATALRYVLLGDASSPHLLKWARALVLVPGLELWVASSRGFLAEFDTVVPQARRLTLASGRSRRGSSLKLLAALPALGRWLRKIDADWLNPHYLTSHGTLAWLAKRGWRLRCQIVGSAWGSDILRAPQRSPLHRWLTQRVLQACALATSDSQHMARRMRELGAGEVMVFPFGLEQMPALCDAKQPWLFFANRALEPLYQPQRVLAAFAQVLAAKPQARLVLANTGSLVGAVPTLAQELGLSVGTFAGGQQVQCVGRLDAFVQASWYAQAQWYVSLPESDSVAVSVLEAMAHGCIPLLSDLPANHELVRSGDNGLIFRSEDQVDVAELESLLRRSDAIGADNRDWIAQHGLFAPSIRLFLARLKALSPA